MMGAFLQEQLRETMSAAGDKRAVSQAVAECKKIRPPECSGREWHILLVPAGCEESAERRLREQRIPGYFPRIRCRGQRWKENQAFFPGLLFAALNEGDRRKLAGSIFVEEIQAPWNKRQAAVLQADILFMVLAERLNCFYPFAPTKLVPPPPAGGIPGYDFAEMRDEHGAGYILLLPGKESDQVFFRFDSIERKIAFEIPKNLFMQILNLQ